MILLAALALPLLGACSSWQPVRKTEAWTLYVQPGAPVELEAFEAALVVAHAAVEAHLGPFERSVRVHAWEGDVAMTSGNQGEIRRAGEIPRDELDAADTARVRAFHTRSSRGLFRSTGVFLGTYDCGTVVHELVHARLAEVRERVPLWFEEGLATILGDGVLADGTWVIDGLAPWPWRELRREALSDDQLQRLLSIRARDDHSVRENVLVHFVGWAVVFDLYRELGTLDWRALLARFDEAHDPLAEARRRMQRTLALTTPIAWLDARRERPAAERLAAVKGTWKLDSRAVAHWLLDALKRETDPEVRAALAINALATAGQTRLSWPAQATLWRTVMPVLRDTELPLADENEALRNLHRAYRRERGDGAAQLALDGLARFWED